jgi:hypothetical protein
MTQTLDPSVSRGLPSKWNDRVTFTVDEAAEILRLSRGSAYAAAIRGTLITENSASASR